MSTRKMNLKEIASLGARGSTVSSVKSPTKSPTETKRRISYLDGHRGLAILLVVLYHAYSRWPEIVPYGDRYADFPVFSFGWLGVQLFFMLSGFVILMSLERCPKIRNFIYRRWIRLFPMMLICSIIIFATAGFFFERPAGAPAWSSLIPGLTFIEPTWWSAVTGSSIEPLEGAFWTLYAEFKFYVFGAIAYYWQGKKFFVGSLIAAFVLSSVAQLGLTFFEGSAFLILVKLTVNLSFDQFGWFAAGAAFYIYSQNRLFKWFGLAVLLSFVSSAMLGFVESDMQAFLIASLVSFLFAISVINPSIQNFLSNRSFLFFGFISYPLYLIHENMMVAGVIKLDKYVEILPPALFPLLMIAVLSGVAFVLVKYVEPPLKRLMSERLA
ncbi:MAG: acyltransferase [Cyanobacteria bacterium J06634_6]